MRIGLLGRLAGCFRDYRNPNSVEHSVRSLLAQRVYGLTLVYEGLYDHDELRRDSLLALFGGQGGSERGLTGARARPGLSAGDAEVTLPSCWGKLNQH